MNLTSLSFILFFAVLTVLYYVFPKKAQWIILLISSYLFYFLVSNKLPVYMIISTVIVHFTAVFVENIDRKQKKYFSENREQITREEKRAIKAQNDKKKRGLLIIAMILNFGILATFKYVDFIIGNVNSVISLFSSASIPFLSLAIPLGISYYTFQSTGYIIDVYRGTCTAQRNIAKTALFVSFFPQIIQGPIGRYSDLEQDLYREHTFSFAEAKNGFVLMLWGFFKKIVISENLSLLFNPVYGEYSDYDGFQVIVATLLYGFLIYADFSGYMDIVSGASQILGIKIAKNFERPYFSKSIEEFWRRWHMSLGLWFKDYLFYPMSVSKASSSITKKMKKHGFKKFGKILPVYIFLIVVWFCTGLWHGANWNQIVWGMMNVAVIIFSIQFDWLYKKSKKLLKINDTSFGWRLFQVVRTYLIMALIRVSCNTTSMQACFGIYKKIFLFPLPHDLSLSYLFPGLIDKGLLQIAVVMLAIGALCVVDLIQRKCSVRELLSRKSWIIQGAVMILLSTAILLFGTYSQGGFMYAQF